MDTDTPQGEPGELSIDEGAEAFLSLLEPVEEVKEEKVDTELDPKTEEKEPEEAEPNAQEEGDDAPITLTVDGKQITLTKAELADAYKNGLRQSDYTQKTMALAEQRKTAEAEAQKAVQERQTYAQNLARQAAQLEGVLEQQAKIDWNDLAEKDPVEWVKQKNLYDQRQALLHRNQQEQSLLAEKFKTERDEATKNHLQAQQEELLAKLPEWKDEAKAKSEREALKAYLTEAGYDPKDVAAISDHKAVILSRKAMLYDQMIAKAQAAAKKVQNLPTKVVRSGTTQTSPLDGRTSAMRNHERSGTVESAAEVFKSLL